MAQVVHRALWQYEFFITTDPEGYMAVASAGQAQWKSYGRTPAHAVTALMQNIGLLEVEGAVEALEARIRELEAENNQLRDQLESRYIRVRDLTTLRIMQTLAMQLGGKWSAIDDAISAGVAELEALMDVEESD
jgi:hypothetical protein